MNILTRTLKRHQIFKFVYDNEGEKAFENLQRDMINIWPQTATIDADVTNSTTAMVDSGMQGGMEALGTYEVEAIITFQSAAVTTGIALAFSLPAGASISGMFSHNTSLTVQDGSYNIASGVAKSATTGVPVANENLPIIGKWIIKNGTVAGNAMLQFASAVAASLVTLKAGLCVVNFRQIS